MRLWSKLETKFLGEKDYSALNWIFCWIIHSEHTLGQEIPDSNLQCGLFAKAFPVKELFSGVV